MQDVVHHSNAGNLTEAILDFSQHLRDQGYNVGIQESLECLQSASLGLITRREEFKYALKSIYCCSEEESLQFEALFSAFWDTFYEEDRRISYRKTVNYVRKDPGSVVFMGKGESAEESEEEAKSVTGANSTERLRRTDFSKVSEIDSEYLEKIIQRLVRQMSLRLNRRMKLNKTGQIDIRSTMRSGIARGGELIDLKRKRRKPGRPKLVLLLDASGSMDKYSFYFLLFAYTLKGVFKNVETFVFSTSIVKVSEAMLEGDLKRTLANLSNRVHNWSSGTKIGGCLKTFNEKHAKRILNGRSVVIIMSDGLDTGDPGLLASELERVRGRTRNLIWLNPLKGSPQYEPTARGMSAAMPQIDTFRSAHNLDSLLELENYLSYV